MISTLSALYLESDAPHPPLRVGVVLSGDPAPAHVASILRDLRAATFTRLVLAVLPERTEPGGAGSASPPSLLRQALSAVADPARRPHALLELYRRVDRRAAHADDPLAPEAIGTLLDGVDRVAIDPPPPGSPPSAATMAAMRAARLDVLLHLGGPLLVQAVAPAARCGAWWFVHGASPRYRGREPHLWELIEGYPRAEVALEAVAAEAPGGVELCAASFNASDTPFASRNGYAPYWESAHFVIRKLRELHREGWPRVLARSAPAPARPAGPGPLPRNRDIARWLGGLVVRKLAARAAGRPVEDRWRLAVRVGARPLTREDGDQDMRGFRWLEPPGGHFWADPFAVVAGDRRLLFFEDYRRGEARGVIACGAITRAGGLEEVRTVLDTGTHLSYPHVFAHAGEWFMIPESIAAGEVALYRALSFPDRWVKEATLFRGGAMDTTAFTHEGRWWFLTTLVDRPRNSGALMLFGADALTGRWRYHPANPISADVRWSRGAGAVGREGDRLLRPSQCGSPAYGYSFTLHQIEVCTETSYRETAWRTVRPTWQPSLAGTHTYNASGDVEVIDVRTQAWAPRHGRRIHETETLSAWGRAPRGRDIATPSPP